MATIMQGVLLTAAAHMSPHSRCCQHTQAACLLHTLCAPTARAAYKTNPNNKPETCPSGLVGPHSSHTAGHLCEHISSGWCADRDRGPTQAWPTYLAAKQPSASRDSELGWLVIHPGSPDPAGTVLQPVPAAAAGGAVLDMSTQLWAHAATRPHSSCHA
jgi:hypothetical protein